MLARVVVSRNKFQHIRVIRKIKDEQAPVSSEAAQMAREKRDCVSKPSVISSHKELSYLESVGTHSRALQLLNFLLLSFMLSISMEMVWVTRFVHAYILHSCQ